MGAIRLGVAFVTCLMLVAGYFAWQTSYFAENTEAYVKVVDASPISKLALILLLAAIVLAVIKPAEDETE